MTGESAELFRVKTEPFEYHPLFGLALPSYRIMCAAEVKLPFGCSTLISLIEGKE